MTALKRMRATDVRVRDRLRMPDQSLQRVEDIRRPPRRLGRNKAEIFFMLENDGLAVFKPNDVVQVAMREEPIYD